MTRQTTDHFVILLAGSLDVTARLRAQVAGARVIAADGGISHARALGLHPELWIGDFDSACAADRAAYDHVPKIAHPPAKDMSDGALAIAQALARGARALTLVGAFGGRTDHAFALMAQATALGEQGLCVCLTSGREEAVPLRPQARAFDLALGTTFSVLAFSDLRGLTLKGAVWPLDGVDIAYGQTTTLSNRTDGPLTAWLVEGRALLLAQLVPGNA